MIKKTVITIVLVLVSQVLFAGTKVFPLQGINKPGQQVYMDKDRLYAVEGSSVFIYSSNDFKLIKQFGKRGQGPQEFDYNSQAPQLATLMLDVQTDLLVIRSLGKLSWFTKNGDFIKEQKLPSPFMMQFFPFGKNYIGQKYDGGTVRYTTLVAYNENFDQLQELAKQEDQFRMGKGLKVLEANPTQTTYKDKLFIAWENDLKIKVLDTSFKELYTISYPLKKTKVTTDDQNKIIEFLKTSPDTKQFFEFLKPITFPDYYPAIATMFGTGDKLYVMTFNSQEEQNKEYKKYEIITFDMKGKFLKKYMYRAKMQDPLQSYPLTIHEGKLYQLIENEDEETWEVHITDLQL